jgi:hypothetical protein
MKKKGSNNSLHSYTAIWSQPSSFFFSSLNDVTSLYIDIMYIIDFPNRREKNFFEEPSLPSTGAHGIQDSMMLPHNDAQHCFRDKPLGDNWADLQ